VNADGIDNPARKRFELAIDGQTAFLDYERLRNDPRADVVPRTYLFAGKAAPAYRFATRRPHLRQPDRRRSPGSGRSSTFVAVSRTMFARMSAWPPSRDYLTHV
jgi:hypothetical protein